MELAVVVQSQFWEWEDAPVSPALDLGLDAGCQHEIESWWAFRDIFGLRRCILVVASAAVLGAVTADGPSVFRLEGDMLLRCQEIALPLREVLVTAYVPPLACPTALPGFSVALAGRSSTWSRHS